MRITVSMDDGGKLVAGTTEHKFVGTVEDLEAWRVEAEVAGRVLRTLMGAHDSFERGTADYTNAVDRLRTLHVELARARAGMHDALAAFCAFFSGNLAATVVADQAWGELEMAAKNFGLAFEQMKRATVTTEAATAPTE